MSNSASAATEISACSNSTGIFGDSVGEKSWTSGSTGTDGAGVEAAACSAGAWGTGRTGAAGASGAWRPMAWVIFSSSGLRGPGCRDKATKRERTSSAADSDAAKVCARNSGGRAFVGLLLEQAAMTSLMACCSSTPERWIPSRLSRSARATACSTAFGSGGIPVLGVFCRNFPCFAILGGGGWGVNGLRVVLCPIRAQRVPREAANCPKSS